MPIGSFQDEQLFEGLNGVMIGYILLVFFPRWKYTPAITLGLCTVYSVMYVLLLATSLTGPNAPEEVDFGSLGGVVSLFKRPDVVFAGWTHYIAFDHFVARYIVLDAPSKGIPHWVVVPLVPLTLMAGPAGLAAYVILEAISKLVAKVNPNGIPAKRSQKVLMALYIALCGLCVMMVSWILVMPGSWMLGNPFVPERLSKFTEDLFRKNVDEGKVPVPPSLVFKYKGHTLVQMLHILPAAIWSAIIPFQLHPDARKMYRGAHKVSGYIFAFMSVCIFLGIGVIDQRGLYYHLVDFPGIPHNEHESEFGLSHHVEFFKIVALWFFFTIVVAVYKATKRQYAAHQRFILRHIAAGIWVAVQRLYFLARNKNDRPGQKETFGDGAFIGLAITVAAAELGIFCIELSKAKSKSA